MDIAGHVSRQMLKHYSHIRMQAKRDALDAVWKKQEQAEKDKKGKTTKQTQRCSPQRNDDQQVEGESLQSGVSEGPTHRKAARKSLKRIGSPRGALLHKGKWRIFPKKALSL